LRAVNSFSKPNLSRQAQGQNLQRFDENDLPCLTQSHQSVIAVSA
jgi:hypothetical protein